MLNKAYIFRQFTCEIQEVLESDMSLDLKERFMSKCDHFPNSESYVYSNYLKR